MHPNADLPSETELALLQALVDRGPATSVSGSRYLHDSGPVTYASPATVTQCARHGWLREEIQRRGYVTLCVIEATEAGAATVAEVRRRVDELVQDDRVEGGAA